MLPFDRGFDEISPLSNHVPESLQQKLRWIKEAGVDQWS
jgi:hypothetical protein